MTKRIVIGGIAGGLVMFIWGAVSHMVLQLGDAGLSQFKEKEELVLTALRDQVKKPGLYFFPGLSSNHPSEAEQKAWQEKYSRGPAGLLLVVPSGSEAMTARQFLVQIASDVGIGLLAAVLLAGTGCWLASFASRVGFVALIGLMPFFAVNLPYWNWYRFPTVFTMAQLVDRFLGFVLIGLTLALIIKPSAAAASPQLQPSGPA
jgi:hypothetical protein